jgi:hypothetical protein
VVVPDGTAHRVTRQIKRLAASFDAPLSPGIVRGDTGTRLMVLTRRQFLNRWLYTTGYMDMGRTVAADLGFSVARFAARSWSPANVPGGWRFGLVGGPREGHEWSQHPGTPDVIARPRGDAWAFEFATQSKDAIVYNVDGEPVSAVAYTLDGRQYRGRFEGVLQASRALLGEDLDLVELSRRLDVGVESGGCVIEGDKITEADLTLLFDRLVAIQRCRNALKAHLDRVHGDAGIELHQLCSVATVARGYLVASGIEGASVLDPQEHAIAAATFMGGRIESQGLRTELPVVIADRSQAYLRDAVFLGTEELLAAGELTTRDATGWLRRLLRGDVLSKTADAAVCRRLSRICVLVQPGGDVLCSRPWLEDRTSPSLVTAPFHSDAPVWVHSFEACAATLAMGRVPVILRAIEYVPTGQRERSSVSFAGVQATKGRLFEAALSLDLASATDPTVALMATGIKGTRASLGYGLSVQVIRESGTNAKQVVHTPWGERTFTGPIEQPGRHLCFVVGTGIAAFARFQLRRHEARYAELGGTIVQMDTDGYAVCATETGGLVPCRGGTLRDERGRECIRALRIADVLDVLVAEAWSNPAGDGTSWRVKYESDTRPTFLRSLGNKRYCAYHRNEDGSIELCFASEILMGGRYLDPYGTEEPGQSRARRFVEELWCHEIDPERYPQLRWQHVPAVRPVTLDRPDVVARWKGAGITTPFGKVCQGEPAPLFGRSPGPIAPWKSDPCAITAWVDPLTGVSARVGLEDDVLTGATSAPYVIATLGCVAQRWVVLREVRSQPVGDKQDGPPVGLMEPRPIHTAHALTEVIGKESQSWGLGFAGVIEAIDDEWLSTFGTASDPVAAILRPAIERITAEISATEAKCTPNSVRSFLDDKHPVSERLRDKLLDVATAHARAALGRGTGPKVRASEVSSRMRYALIELWLRTDKAGRLCEWPTCLKPVKGRRRFCSDTCQKRAKRKEDRERLAVIGAIRCRRTHCRIVRFGDTSSPCPGCNDEPLASVAGCCRKCRTTFYGGVPVPCPFCEEEAA